jgi:hypothetical protein
MKIWPYGSRKAPLAPQAASVIIDFFKATRKYYQKMDEGKLCP